jgi:pyruvate kinase
MRKTKIIVTLGPATESEEAIAELVAAGADVFRLNMSHAQPDWVREIVPRVVRAAETCGRNVALLMDLQGPSIRTGDLDEPLVLEIGDQVELTLDGAPAEIGLSTSANYPGLAEDLSAGDVVLLDNGEIHLRVTATCPERVSCEALTGGTIGSRRHINLPGVHVRLPGLTERDHSNAALAAEVGVDFVALSFAREAEHVEELRSMLEQAGSRAQVVSKIEDQEAMRNLDEIILASDVVMVARGDLGIEVHIEELPIIQRRIVRKCIELGRRVIVATHMLESMVESPSPTRAEVTDVANAAYEQTDAVMLSGETSVGAYPTKCVEVLHRIVARNEQANAGFAEGAILKTYKQKTVKAAVVLADSLPGCKIAVFTKRGLMANYVANLRPSAAPIYAFTEDPQVVRNLCLTRAVTAFQITFLSEAEGTIDRALDNMKRRGLADVGDTVVVLSDVLGGEFVQDSIHLREVE